MFVQMYPCQHELLCTEKECFENVLENAETHLRMKFMDQTIVQPRKLTIQDVIEKERVKEIRQNNRFRRKDVKRQQKLQEQRRQALSEAGQIHADFFIVFTVPQCWKGVDFRSTTMSGENLVASLDDLYLRQRYPDHTIMTKEQLQQSQKMQELRAGIPEASDEDEDDDKEDEKQGKGAEERNKTGKKRKKKR